MQHHEGAAPPASGRIHKPHPLLSHARHGAVQRPQPVLPQATQKACTLQQSTAFYISFARGYTAFCGSSGSACAELSARIEAIIGADTRHVLLRLSGWLMHDESKTVLQMHANAALQHTLTPCNCAGFVLRTTRPIGAKPARFWGHLPDSDNSAERTKPACHGAHVRVEVPSQNFNRHIAKGTFRGLRQGFAVERLIPERGEHLESNLQLLPRQVRISLACCRLVCQFHSCCNMSCRPPGAAQHNTPITPPGGCSRDSPAAQGRSVSKISRVCEPEHSGPVTTVINKKTLCSGRPHLCPSINLEPAHRAGGWQGKSYTAGLSTD